MKRNASRAVVLTLLLAGAITTNAQRDLRDQSLDLIRFLATKPWAGRGHNRWDRAPRFDADLVDRFTKDRWLKPEIAAQDDEFGNYVNDDSDIKVDPSVADEDLSAEVPKSWGASKRSAVATALNGRRRRQPAPALGVLNDVGTFFDSLRDNLESLTSLSPHQRATLFSVPPSVVGAPSSGGGGGGSTGMRRLHALRPLRPTGNIRTYNRRSFVEAGNSYPGANHHDPGLLWTGLGR